MKLPRSVIHCLVSRLQVISAVNADTDTDASHHNPDKLSHVTQSSLQFKNYENVSGKYDVMHNDVQLQLQSPSFNYAGICAQE